MTDDRNVKTKIQFQSKNNTESYNKALESFIDTSISFICTQQSSRGDHHGQFPF